MRTRVCSCLDESGKLRGPLIPASPRPGHSKGGRGSAARLGAILPPWGRGRASPGPRKVRLGAGCPTRPTPAPRRRARESPLSQPGWDGRRAFPSRAGTQSPEQRPRGSGGRELGVLGLTRSLGVSGTSPRSAPGPSGSESGRLPWLRARGPGCASRWLLRGAPARPGPRREEEAGAGGRVGPRGGRGCRGQGPGRRERRQKGVAGDDATSPPIAGLGPPGGPGTPARRSFPGEAERVGHAAREPPRAAEGDRWTGAGGARWQSPSQFAPAAGRPPGSPRARLPAAQLGGGPAGRPCGEAPGGGGVRRHPRPGPPSPPGGLPQPLVRHRGLRRVV